MKIDIIRIGNSQGIRLPKAIIEQCGFEKSLELEVRGHEVVLRAPRRKPREGWDESIATAVAEHGQPELLWPDDMVNEFDETEWTWPEEDLRDQGEKK
jgi:antitoxin MazE